MSSSLMYLVDVALACVLFRLVLGLLVTHRGLLRFLVLVVVLAGCVWGVEQLGLGISKYIVFAMAVPVGLLLVANILPELRRLYQAARVGQLFGVTGQVVDEVVPELTSAVLEMAKNRMGAILVFPRSEDIEELVQGGEVVQARINKSLLLSIFNTSAPRHDGAVLIRGSQLMRIGAVLPLATADRVRAEWGTRHLAALGLSQQCDAHVLVVSEERGTVSHVVGGQLRELGTADETAVRDALVEAMGLTPDEATKRSRRFFAGSLWLAALLAAIAGANMVRDFERIQQSAPVEVRPFTANIILSNVPGDLFIEKQSETTAQVFLQVPQAGGLFTTPELTVNVDLKDYVAGKNEISLTREMLRGVPENWELDRFAPAGLEVTLAKSRILDLRVEPSYSGLDEDLVVGSHSVNPPTIQVEVRDSTYTPESKLLTKPIDLAAVKEPLEMTVSREVVFPERVRPIQRDQKAPVAVTLDIIQNPRARR